MVTQTCSAVPGERGAPDSIQCVCELSSSAALSPLSDYAPIIAAGIGLLVAAWGIRMVLSTIRLAG